MTTGKDGSGGTALSTAGATAGAEGKGADVGTNGAAGTQASTEKPAGAAGTELTAEQKVVAEQKAAAELAAKPFTDVAQLKLAEGLKLDEAVMKDFLPLAKEAGFTAAQAQKLVEFQATLSKRTDEARATALDATAAKVLEELKKDPEVGGAQFEANMKLAGSALRKFGGAVDEKTGKSEIVEALATARLEDGSMLGDNRFFARFLANVGKAIAEDQVGTQRNGGARKTAVNDDATFNAEMYPNSPELKR